MCATKSVSSSPLAPNLCLSDPADLVGKQCSDGKIPVMKNTVGIHLHALRRGMGFGSSSLGLPALAELASLH